MPSMNVGQLKELLSLYDDNFPVILSTDGGEYEEWSVELSEGSPDDDEQPTVVLEAD